MHLEFNGLAAGKYLLTLEGLPGYRKMLTLQGGTFGSEKLGRMCIVYAKYYFEKREPGGLEALMKRLDINWVYIEYQVLASFESYKESFQIEEDKVITIRGRNGQKATLRLKK